MSRRETPPWLRGLPADLVPIEPEPPRGLHRYNQFFSFQDLDSAFPPRLPPAPSSATWPRQGSKRGLLMALLTAVFLAILVISAGVYVSSYPSAVSSSRAPKPGSNLRLDAPGQLTQNGVRLEDVLSGKFSSRPFNGTWISDVEIQYLNDRGDVVILNVSSQSTTLIVSGLVLATNLEGKLPGRCALSADRKYLLISYDAQKIYRHSSYAKYEIYDIESRQFTSLVPNELHVQHRLLQLAQWAPVGNAIAFVYANNIYYRSTALSATSIQITTDGSLLVYNGVTDWVYEEEMFGTDSALWFSPGGKSLAFASFNDTPVDLIQYPVYGEPGMPEYQYPLIETIPYPKSGRANPTAKVSVVSLPKEGSGRLRFIKDLQFPEVPAEHYIGTALWATDTELLVVTLNRRQNDSRHHLCTSSSMSGNCETILINQEPRGWIDLEVPKASSDGSQFLTLTSQIQEDRSFRHILLYGRGTNKSLTSGQFGVDSILGWDQARKKIYFTAPFYDTSTKVAGPSQTHLYSVDDSGAQAAQCLTCRTNNSFSEPCLTNSFEMSKGLSYAVRSCSGPNVPEITVVDLKTMGLTQSWVSNAELRARAKTVRFPLVRNYDIPLNNGFVIKARLELPPNFNPDFKYPMLVDVYGGPGSQKITDSYMVDWATSLVTSRGVVYASIDGRGSGRQSDDLKFQVNRNLGTVEIEDQIYGAEWLIKNVEFLDANRTAIWGWSYGGYSTAMVMGSDLKGVYKCGISVAPVTSWLFYDTIYTERYMSVPSDNFPAYNRSDVTNHIENFRTKKYFLIHGNADDNVHYQQSMVLSRALEKADILFRQQSYPDENHGLGGVRKHLYHTLEDFLFTQCF